MVGWDTSAFGRVGCTSGTCADRRLAYDGATRARAARPGGDGARRPDAGDASATVGADNLSRRNVANDLSSTHLFRTLQCRNLTGRRCARGHAGRRAGRHAGYDV
jgi:hypothetical protein